MQKNQFRKREGNMKNFIRSIVFLFIITGLPTAASAISVTVTVRDAGGTPVPNGTCTATSTGTSVTIPSCPTPSGTGGVRIEPSQTGLSPQAVALAQSSTNQVLIRNTRVVNMRTLVTNVEIVATHTFVDPNINDPNQTPNLNILNNRTYEVSHRGYFLKFVNSVPKAACGNSTTLGENVIYFTEQNAAFPDSAPSTAGVQGERVGGVDNPGTPAKENLGTGTAAGEIVTYSVNTAFQNQSQTCGPNSPTALNSFSPETTANIDLRVGSETFKCSDIVTAYGLNTIQCTTNGVQEGKEQLVTRLTGVLQGSPSAPLLVLSNVGSFDALVFTQGSHGLGSQDPNELQTNLDALTVRWEIQQGGNVGGLSPIDPNDNGRLALVIKGSQSVDVNLIDSTSLRLGPGQAAPVGPINIKDWDGDGDDDLRVTFKNLDANLSCGVTEVTLSGHSNDFGDFSATEQIFTTPCQ